jgi:hypothetical protein
MTDFTLNLTYDECDIVEAALVLSVKQWDGEPDKQAKADAARQVINQLLCRFQCIDIDDPSIVTDDPMKLFDD